jgi:Leucine-rich repeat (LRR) protein
MKVLLTSFSTLLLLLRPLMVSGAATDSTNQLHAADSTNQPPIFADKKLEAAVRKYVFDKRDTDKPLVEADVVNVSTIEAKGLGITNLTGLEKCQSLAALDLAKNQIKNLAPLKHLSRLQSLTLSQNQIEDISPLASVPALQYLELTGNRVRDVQPLAELTNLTCLYLTGNQVSDIAPLLKLRRLVSLYLDENDLRSIDGISELKNLSSLALRSNALCDLTPLKGLQNLSWLFLERNKIHDLAPLVDMARGDKEQRFAPFLNLYVEGNPLAPEGSNQLATLKQIGVRVHP